ncbi:aldose epimerase family protein [Zunongwangia sp. HGR-M22]|uniref:aldose epimerase family protein n=1 Tax=Zunongwangia sp. HGR-M22 TaxID=3015168 RepID=UPI0022DD5BB5|nr:aldose epimerase family protein [Zunongwangia sp. HGR-M22]WBL26843.1 galactose mutarotase [Zunongwangia sp. HGR-M22]
MENKTELKTVKLVNAANTEVSIVNFGAAIGSIKFYDKNQKMVNVIVSPLIEDLPSPLNKAHNQCFGASIGRYAGRITEGKFELDGKEFSLHQENGVHLHGGENGFHYKYWEFVEENHDENPSVKLKYFSKHNEEGYPGNLEVFVTYTLHEDNNLVIEYEAKTDKKTVINLTNHAYFNLNGEGSVSDHFLKINADKILEIDEKQLPTGNLNNLRGHAKDFGHNRLIGNRNLDDTFVLNSDGNELAAQLFAPLTGIKLDMSTNQPGVVVYAPEALPEDLTYQTRISEFPSICFEGQNFPDAPNFRNFPSAVLEPGEDYYNRISFKFSVKK